jgi:hypothetical protein
MRVFTGISPDRAKSRILDLAKLDMEPAPGASVIHLSYKNVASFGTCWRKEVKKVKSRKKEDRPGRARQTRNRRILAGAGYFTPERRYTTAVGAVWIDFTVRLDEEMTVNDARRWARKR